MALVFSDRVKETTTTTGTGTYSLDGGVVGFRTFVAGIGTTNTCYYCATDGTDWEIGLGTVTDSSPDTLSRDSILASSNAGAAVNWGAGTKTIFNCQPASIILPTTGGVMTGGIDLNGNRLTLDADADSYMEAGSDDNLDIFFAGQNCVDWGDNGTNQFIFLYRSVELNIFTNTGGINFGASETVKLVRDANYTLGFRNSTNPIVQRIYNTFTNTTNYEAAYLGWSGNEFTIQPIAAGTGTARQLNLDLNGGRITLDADADSYVEEVSDDLIRFTLGAATLMDLDDTYLDIHRFVRMRNVLRIDEVAAPGGTTDAGTLYCQDNGSGKTQLMVKFGTGGGIQLAIEA